ncbi:MAG: hypothetical protein IKJ95_07670 [Bacteroidaceae bacterium]|nr:hypothetical protein [Bacteroidaceae bacterium]
MSDTEKKILDRIKKQMKEHGLVSYKVRVLEGYIGKIKAIPKGWKLLLVPIKGYYYDDFELEKIMHLNGELYFIVKKEYQTYNVPFKKEFFRFTWDELVSTVESTPWSIRTFSFGGKGHTTWRTGLLKAIERNLSFYDAHEELKEKLSDRQIEILVERIESEKSLAEKLVDRMLGY